MMQTIDTITLASWIQERRNFVLLDTLPASAFSAGHIPNAINIVPDNILEQAPKLFSDRKTKIVVYCASSHCQRAELSAERLNSLGYVNVFHYVGGKKDWVADGLSLDAKCSR